MAFGSTLKQDKILFLLKTISGESIKSAIINLKRVNDIGSIKLLSFKDAKNEPEIKIVAIVAKIWAFTVSFKKILIKFKYLTQFYRNFIKIVIYKSRDDPASLLAEDGLKIKIRNFMAWVFLFIAGIFEVCWALGLKYSDGFTKIIPSLFTIITMLISFYFLSLALRTLPMGTAYAIWVGVGSVGIVIAGVILFNESINLLRIISILFIVLGIIGLKLATK
jgi:quaternary ammonium compound-resistance protein SugE